MANAGYSNTIEVSTDDTTYNDIGDANSSALSLTVAELDDTEFGDTAISRIGGLFDSGVTVSGNVNYSDTGQSALRTAFLARSAVYIRQLPDGTNGFKVQCRVFGYEESASPSDLATFSCTIQGIAAPTAV